MEQKTILIAKYDGAYRQNENVPAKSDFEAVRQFRKDGGIFGIHTDRDVYEVLAIYSIINKEYDFIACSYGANLITQTSGISGDIEYYGVGTENERPSHLSLSSIPPYVLYDLFGILEGVGMTGMTVDTPCFRGGSVMGNDFADTKEKVGGVGCFVRYWYDGMIFNRMVGREALNYIFPASRCVVRFKSAMVAESAAKIVQEKFHGLIRIYPDGSTFTVSPAKADYLTGIKGYLDRSGISSDNIWIAGNDDLDADLMTAFKGIAINGNDRAKAAAKHIVSNIADAIEIINKA